MAVQPLTPEELHYGRAVYASVHAETERLYETLMDAVVRNCDRVSPIEYRAITYGVAHWLKAYGPDLSPSDISDLYDLALERIK